MTELKKKKVVVQIWCPKAQVLWAPERTERKIYIFMEDRSTSYFLRLENTLCHEKGSDKNFETTNVTGTQQEGLCNWIPGQKLGKWRGKETFEPDCGLEGTA